MNPTANLPMHLNAARSGAPSAFALSTRCSVAAILLTNLLVLMGPSASHGDEVYGAPVESWMSAHGTDKYGAWAEFTVNSATQRLRWIRPGTFVMGSPEDEPGHRDSEMQHKVTLTHGYWLADSECTQSLWCAVLGDAWRRNFPFGDIKAEKDSSLPASQLHDNEIQDFFKALSSKVPGLNACLPTEAQWEYACRAGTTGPYAGNLKDMAWMYENADHKPHPVKTKVPNAWGLYDMHGNVYEWCQDYFTDYPAGPVSDPISTSGTEGRVIRGGSYYYHAGYLRSASRWGADPNSDCQYIGFRICVPVAASPAPAGAGLQK